MNVRATRPSGPRRPWYETLDDSIREFVSRSYMLVNGRQRTVVIPSHLRESLMRFQDSTTDTRSMKAAQAMCTTFVEMAIVVAEAGHLRYGEHLAVLARDWLEVQDNHRSYALDNAFSMNTGTPFKPRAETTQEILVNNGVSLLQSSYAFVKYSGDDGLPSVSDLTWIVTCFLVGASAFQELCGQQAYDEHMQKLTERLNEIE